METRTLNVELATRESVAAFGEIVAADKAKPPMESPFYDGKVRMFRPATVKNDDDVDVAVTVVDRRPLQVRWMERHFKHTQMFIPLEGRPFIAVMAPPNDKEVPDLDDARAFLFDGTAGFSLHVGTWHEFPFPLIDDTQLIVLLRKEATNGLLADAVIDGEGASADLDKKDVAKRLGVVLEAKL